MFNIWSWVFIFIAHGKLFYVVKENTISMNIPTVVSLVQFVCFDI